MLYIVATPIGNAEDITVRALNTLKSVNYIFCEDTRVTQKLLQIHGLKASLIALHEFSDKNGYEKALSMLNEGMDIAYVPDAGTPGISDPGAKPVALARKENHRVIPIPGPSALTAFLSVSGIDSTSFTFHGFFPRENKPKEELLEKVMACPSIHIFYEAPTRIFETLESIHSIIPNCEYLIGRELTKMHEEIFSGNFEEVIDRLKTKQEELNGSMKGEFVFSIFFESIESEKKIDFELIKNDIAKLRSDGYRTKDISSLLSKKYKISQKEIYDLIIKN